MDEKHVDYSIYIAGLIYRYRNGSLSGEALTELNAWIAANDGNRLLFEELTGDDVLFDDVVPSQGRQSLLCRPGRATPADPGERGPGPMTTSRAIIATTVVMGPRLRGDDSGWRKDDIFSPAWAGATE